MNLVPSVRTQHKISDQAYLGISKVMPNMDQLHLKNELSYEVMIFGMWLGIQQSYKLVQAFHLGVVRHDQSDIKVNLGINFLHVVRQTNTSVIFSSFKWVWSVTSEHTKSNSNIKSSICQD